MGNTVTAVYSESGKSVTRQLYQYDYGQRLILEGFDLPEAYEVHFSNVQKMEATTGIGDSTGVDIPDIYLTQGYSIYAWLYLHTRADDGETVYHIIIPVAKRSRPVDAPPNASQRTAIEQTIAALDAAVAHVESIADTKINVSEKGVSGGVAELGEDGRVPAEQLPGFVDDIEEFASADAFPEEGATNKLYVALDSQKVYRWSGTQYTEISSSVVIGETADTAFAGNRGVALEEDVAAIEAARGSAGGYASLGSDGTLPIEQLSSAVPRPGNVTWGDLYNH